MLASEGMLAAIMHCPFEAETVDQSFYSIFINNSKGTKYYKAYDSSPNNSFWKHQVKHR